MHDLACYCASTGRRHIEMSIIIDVFVMVYLTAIVLTICLGVVWVLSLFFDKEMKAEKVLGGRLHRHF